MLPATPRAGDPTLLLMHADGTNGSTTFTDSSSYARTLTATNGAQVNTSAPKFGSGAADLSTSNASRIIVSQPTDFNFGAGQFTIEAWGYYTAYNTAQGQPIATHWLTSGSQLSWYFGTVIGNLSFYYSTNGSTSASVSGAYTPTLNTWVHLAVDRDASNVVRLYANGVVIASGTVAATLFASSAGTWIGNNVDDDTDNFTGRLDEVRISNVARYGGAFTPPTAPFDSGGVTQARVVMMA